MIIGSVRVMLILTMTLSSNVNGDKIFLKLSCDLQEPKSCNFLFARALGTFRFFFTWWWPNSNFLFYSPLSVFVWITSSASSKSSKTTSSSLVGAALSKVLQGWILDMLEKWKVEYNVCALFFIKKKSELFTLFKKLKVNRTSRIEHRDQEVFREGIGIAIHWMMIT